MVRTISVVQRAVSAWAGIFQLPTPVWNPERSSCADLSRSVKVLLSSCPSSVEEERFAFQSIKKLLPPSCKCQEGSMLEDLVLRLSRPRRNLPSGYMAFVRKTVTHLFPKGWDSGSYERHCRTTSPPLSATLSSSRREGGCQGEQLDHSSYLDAVLNGFEGDLDERAALLVVQSAGKPRPLTKFSSEMLLLKPLHKALFDHLSKFSWLCRGDPTAQVLEKAGFRKSGPEVLVSGDYKSATDNLSIEVAEECLRVALSHAVSVPESVRAYALRALRPLLFSVDLGVEFSPVVGQMMGSLLSFPLLCLQNYLAFRWVRHRTGLNQRLPLLINGDDILFQSTRSFSRAWSDTVAGLGLEVELTKTSFSNEFGSLNSTLFRWEGELLRVVPTLRFGMLAPRDFITGIGLSFSSFVKDQPCEVRYRAACCWFSYFISSIRSSRHTLPELLFTGSLAWRMEKKFSILSDCAFIAPPKNPVGHNIALSSDNCVVMDGGVLSSELDELNGLEMVSWKWAVDYSSARTRSVLRYCLQLSSVRPQFPDFHRAFARIRLSPSLSRERWRRSFFPRVRETKEVIVFRTVLLTQESLNDILPRYEDGLSVPPSYEEAEAAVGGGGG
jgi:hypothetical protein